VRIHLELEADDVKDMIEQYFAAQGFAVRNLPLLCAAFETAYPEGIRVEAQPAQMPEPEPIPARSFEPEDLVPVGITQEGSLVVVAPPVSVGTKSNPRLKYSDMMDPSMHGNAPSRDELLLETQRELQEILSASKAIERERSSNNE
jgi:hypothetical protein